MWGLDSTRAHPYIPSSAFLYCKEVYFLARKEGSLLKITHIIIVLSQIFLRPYAGQQSSALKGNWAVQNMVNMYKNCGIMIDDAE